MRLLIICCVLLAGCPMPPVCEPEASRCDGQRAELCSAEGQWQLVADCAAVPEGAMCVAAHDDGVDLHGCVPTSGGEQ